MGKGSMWCEYRTGILVDAENMMVKLGVVLEIVIEILLISKWPLFVGRVKESLSLLLWSLK